MHYDYGKTVANRVFHQTGMMHQPPQVLLKAIAADEILGNNKGIVGVIIGYARYKYGDEVSVFKICQ